MNDLYISKVDWEVNKHYKVIFWQDIYGLLL